MRKITVIFLISIISANISLADNFFEQVNTFLDKYVENGMVDYEKLHSNSNELDDLVDHIANTTLRLSPAEDKKAFLINSYNILVIKGIIDNYPLNSPLNVDGFFDKIEYNVAGEMLTLNEIENKKIREVYNDPKVHFALVCAAKGCPKLLSEAYFPSELNRQLRKKTTEELNDPLFIQVEGSQKKVKVSEIFKWYKADFGGTENIISFINKFSDNTIPKDYTLEYYEYNWSLNEKK